MPAPAKLWAPWKASKIPKRRAHSVGRSSRRPVPDEGSSPPPASVTSVASVTAAASRPPAALGRWQLPDWEWTPEASWTIRGPLRRGLFSHRRPAGLDPVDAGRRPAGAKGHWSADELTFRPCLTSTPARARNPGWACAGDKSSCTPTDGITRLGHADDDSRRPCHCRQELACAGSMEPNPWRAILVARSSTSAAPARRRFVGLSLTLTCRGLVSWRAKPVCLGYLGLPRQGLEPATPNGISAHKPAHACWPRGGLPESRYVRRAGLGWTTVEM
ncbi:hypothetical protein VFPFJ_01827 [Purpureocillium lilacinum]|uniref:Uncharacterized protein n=1 Tax=Purpureocillium lilacinum TaxID=33203 RepID=A0A179HQD9_PURLI|nr:hypothetical protein VFPFJ_01827 [Purpureocillium lilacinum]OAQ92666.1 hypothetical protein VFPFJ_01827 [Purpureocillium lilacinum]